MNRHIRNFIFILAAGLLSALIGGLFGAGIGILSPHFVEELFGPKESGLLRYSAAVGSIWGLFLGAGAMAFCLGIAAVANWFRPRSAGSPSG